MLTIKAFKVSTEMLKDINFTKAFFKMQLKKHLGYHKGFYGKLLKMDIGDYGVPAMKKIKTVVCEISVIKVPRIIKLVKHHGSII